MAKPEYKAHELCILISNIYIFLFCNLAGFYNTLTNIIPKIHLKPHRNSSRNVFNLNFTFEFQVSKQPFVYFSFK